MCSNSEYVAMPTWDVSQVTNMSNAFNGTSSFNGDISKWDVSSVTNMTGMFQSAASFNEDGSDSDENAHIEKNFYFSGSEQF